MNCHHCSNPLPSKQVYRHSNFCKRDCWIAAGKPKAVVKEIACECCEQVFKPRRNGQTLCSNECKSDHIHHVHYANKLIQRLSVPHRCCVQCGVRLSHDSRTDRKRCGSEECEKAWKRADYKRKGYGLIQRTEVESQCPQCEKPFKQSVGKVKRVYCAPQCLRKAGKKARKKHASAKALVLQFLFRRNPNCGICNKRVDLSLDTPHPYAPSVDHIKPLCKGGEHDIDNVQLAHFSCNARKGSKDVTRGRP